MRWWLSPAQPLVRCPELVETTRVLPGSAPGRVSRLPVETDLCRARQHSLTLAVAAVFRETPAPRLSFQQSPGFAERTATWTEPPPGLAPGSPVHDVRPSICVSLIDDQRVFCLNYGGVNRRSDSIKPVEADLTLAHGGENPISAGGSTSACLTMEFVPVQTFRGRTGELRLDGSTIAQPSPASTPQSGQIPPTRLPSARNATIRSASATTRAPYSRSSSCSSTGAPIGLDGM